MLLQLPAMLLLTPFVRPFRWSRLLLTYLVPLVPLIVLFDGTVSLLRLYLEDELRELVRQVPGHDTFEWDISSARIRDAPIGVTCLVGIPKQSGDTLRNPHLVAFGSSRPSSISSSGR
jgi:hypothetical protein